MRRKNNLDTNKIGIQYIHNLFTSQCVFFDNFILWVHNYAQISKQLYIIHKNHKRIHMPNKIHTKIVF
jgi:hypothetical protein